MLPSFVPLLQQKVLQNELVAANPKLVAMLSHPAGPFTGETASQRGEMRVED
jgi:hypothetical protein